MFENLGELKKGDEKPGEEEQVAGQNISLNFAVHALPSQVTDENLEFKSNFQMGQDFQWVQLVVANRLGFAYDDITLKFNGKGIPGPFSISDWPIKQNDELDVYVSVCQPQVREEATPASQMQAEVSEEAKVALGQSSEEDA